MLYFGSLCHCLRTPRVRDLCFHGHLPICENTMQIILLDSVEYGFHYSFG